ncbi:M23 family metallopeptidase [Marinibactrum halimedae]|uniref:M23ase beta-sheet core domain-containing protein n=1 Tax=Marinibactrum halimedae TaxID=1444977 RepID=A0AA37T8S6_9GAMM|nr:M23 family metallopeptidase [Marinibactrum halimedae]MCD9459612.1 peptidoglycan DD-metalloendopeptidase family protein [Marinibactrum halimedae]GLS25570.1 hypothetical protein GCM10007877_12840 [Marinibactrum halimedae]
MKVIVVGKNHSRTRSFNISSWARALLSICLLGIPLGATLIGYQLGAGRDEQTDVLADDSAQALKQAIDTQKRTVEQTRRETEEHLAALTLRMAELQARLVRLDALGERLTTIAKLDSGEFDFSQTPALGGPESLEAQSTYIPPTFIEVIDQLADQIADREQQLETLEILMANRKIQSDLFIAGRPIKKGWMSSRFGRRTDPFNGKIAWHGGVDFAGKFGSDIISVASGVVTWSDKRSGYGQMVEVSHGGGFSTRYAHNSENLVKVGDVVKKGQVIALMGSSGRSTGPHVHFEVYKNGRAVDPSSYIHRTHR